MSMQNVEWMLYGVVKIVAIIKGAKIVLFAGLIFAFPNVRKRKN